VSALRVADCNGTYGTPGVPSLGATDANGHDSRHHWSFYKNLVQKQSLTRNPLRHLGGTKKASFHWPFCWKFIALT